MEKLRRCSIGRSIRRSIKDYSDARQFSADSESFNTFIEQRINELKDKLANHEKTCKQCKEATKQGSLFF